MKYLKWLITIVFLTSSICLISQDYGYANSSFRFGIGSEFMLSENVETEDLLNSVVFYGGFQIRKLDGRLRVIPSIDFSHARIRFDQSTNIDIVGMNLSLSANYDIFRKSRSSIFIGAGGGLRAQSMFLRACQLEIDCEYVKLGGDNGSSFNIDFGYRNEKPNSLLGFELLSRFSAGEVGRFFQLVMIVDLKLK